MVDMLLDIDGRVLLFLSLKLREAAHVDANGRR